MNVRRAVAAVFWSAVVGVVIAVPIAAVGLAVTLVGWVAAQAGL